VLLLQPNPAKLTQKVLWIGGQDSTKFGPAYVWVCFGLDGPSPFYRLELSHESIIVQGTFMTPLKVVFTDVARMCRWFRHMAMLM
jgi:hypothetical protein